MWPNSLEPVPETDAPGNITPMPEEHQPDDGEFEGEGDPEPKVEIPMLPLLDIMVPKVLRNIPDKPNV